MAKPPSVATHPTWADPVGEKQLDAEGIVCDTLLFKFSDLGQNAPRNPAILATPVVRCFVWPVPDYFTSPYSEQLNAKEIDRLFANLLKAARDLQRILPSTDHYYALATALSDRVPAGSAGDKVWALLQKVDEVLPVLASPPRIPRRLSLPKEVPTKQPYVRDVVRVVFWYLWKFERVEPTLSFIGRSPSGKAGILCSVILEVLELPLCSHLLTHMRAVYAEESWRDRRLKWWHFLPKSSRTAVR